MDEQNQNRSPEPNYPQPTNDTPPSSDDTPVVPSEFEPATPEGQPAAFGTPVQTGPNVPVPGERQVTPQPQKRKKWPLVAAGVALIIVLIGAGSALAYSFWYQNPQRVMMDGLANALEAKTLSYVGTVNVTKPDDKISVMLNIKGAAGGGSADLDVTATIGQEDQQYQLHGKGVFDKGGVLYVRFQDVAKTIDDFLKNSPEVELPEGTEPLIDKLVAKIDNRWIKIRPSDLDEYSSESSKALTCVKDAVDTLRSDKKTQQELTALYQKNPFIRIDENLGMKNGSIGYAISPDENKQKAFWTGMKDTAVYKKIQDCDDDFKLDEEDLELDDVKSQRTELWVSQWKHEITRLNVRTEDKDGTTTEVAWLPTFDQPVNIEVPSDAATLSELQADIQNIVMEYMMSQMGESSSSPYMFGQQL